MVRSSTHFAKLHSLIVSATIAAGAVLVSATAASANAQPLAFIQTDVQDVTTGSATIKADTSGNALLVHPGDTIKYSVTVLNQANGAGDDLVNTVISDQLPTGVDFVSAESYDMGAITPRTSSTRTITMKVSTGATGIIKNEACFTGASTDGKITPHGCDPAYIKIATATTSPSASPKTTSSPSTSPKTPSPAPTSSGTVLGSSNSGQPLPNTGASLAGTALGLGAIATATVAYIRARRRTS